MSPSWSPSHPGHDLTFLEMLSGVPKSEAKSEATTRWQFSPSAAQARADRSSFAVLRRYSCGSTQKAASPETVPAGSAAQPGHHITLRQGWPVVSRYTSIHCGIISVFRICKNDKYVGSILLFCTFHVDHDRYPGPPAGDSSVGKRLEPSGQET